MLTGNALNFVDSPMCYELSSSRMCACCECLSRKAKTLRLRPGRRRYSSVWSHVVNLSGRQYYVVKNHNEKVNYKRPTERRDGSRSICSNQMRMIGRHLNKCLLRLRFNVQCLSNRMRLFLYSAHIRVELINKTVTF